MRGSATILVLIPVLLLSFLVLTFVLKSKGFSLSQVKPETVSRALQTKPNAFAQPSPDQTVLSSPQLLPLPTPSPDPVVESKISFQQAPSPSPSLRPQQNSPSVSSGSNYTVLSYNLGATTVVTDDASDDDCSNNCPTKTLQQFINDNGAHAGMNGTYFCPPDYSWCGGKVNSSDFPVWNNHKKKWMNASKLFWGGRGMMVFRPGSAQFFANGGGAPNDITGGLVNYPSLLAGGNVVFNEGSLPAGDKLRQKGTRNAIGFGSGKIFLLVARNADMYDLVNIFKSLGATDALNTDGGGSSALYDGGYKVGPGRLLPNAIIIK